MLIAQPGLRANEHGVLGRFILTGMGSEVSLHEYELVVVMNSEIAEEDVPAALDRVTAAVTGRGGEVVEVAPWGRRKLAYPINRHLEGNYVVTQIRLDPARAHELESGFAISDDIIRHLLIRKDEE
jgi:small subunit ribosomal protein S6